MERAAPYVEESEWTRLWEHTLSGTDRRRITRSVKTGQLLEDPVEALLAAELARRMRTPRPIPRWLVRLYGAMLVVSLALAFAGWPDLAWNDFLVPVTFAIQGALAYRGWHAQTQERPQLLDAENRNLARARQVDPAPGLSAHPSDKPNTADGRRARP